MRIVYVAGPYRGEIKYNVLKAAAVGRLLRQCGKAVIIPHVESLFFPESLTEEEWIEHGIDLLHCVDTVVLVPEWQDSSGTRNEIEYGKEYKKSVYEFDELCNILKADRSIRFDDYFAEYSQFVARLDSYRKELDKFIITPFNEVVDPSTIDCILDRDFFCGASFIPKNIDYTTLGNEICNLSVPRSSCFADTLMIGGKTHTISLEQDSRIELGRCPIDNSIAVAKIYCDKKIKSIVCNAQATMVNSKFICNKNNDKKCKCFSITKNKKKSNKKVTPVTKNNNGSS
jgi:hypothetical protein